MTGCSGLDTKCLPKGSCIEELSESQFSKAFETLCPLKEFLGEKCS